MVYKWPADRGTSITIYGCLSSYFQFMHFDYGISTNTGEFHDFLVQLDQKYSFKNKYVVMDNHSSHTGGETVAFIEDMGGIPHFLPPRASELNPIEKAWSILKREWRRHLLRFREVDEFGEADMKPVIKRLLKENIRIKQIKGLQKAAYKEWIEVLLN